VPLHRPMLARVARQQPGRPQLMRIAQLLGLATGQVDQPRLRRDCDGGLFAGSRPIIERRQRTIGNRPLDTALHGLMVHAKSPAHGEVRRVFSIGEKHSRPLNMACRLGPRPRHLPQMSQVLLSDHQFHNPTPRRHDCSPRSVNHSRGDKWESAPKCPKDPKHAIYGIGRLVRNQAEQQPDFTLHRRGFMPGGQTPSDGERSSQPAPVARHCE
jgi:hypothetical protein